MKKQDIRNAYTQKVTELLNQGYTIFPDTMNGSQGEVAHIDLTNGSETIRVLLERGLCWSHISDGFHGDVITLTIGRAATPEERSRQQEAAAQRRERQELAHAFQNWKQYAWIIYSTYYRQLRQWKEVYAPASIEVHRHPLFIEALQRLDYISYCLDILDRGTDEQQLQFYRTHRIEVKNIESRIIGRHEQRRTGATA